MKWEREKLTKLTVKSSTKEGLYQFYGAMESLSVAKTAAERRVVTLTSAKTIQKGLVEHRDDIN